MFNASSASSMNVGIGMISSSTVRNSAPVKIRSARFSSSAIELEVLALISGHDLHPARFQTVKIVAVRAVNHREDLRDRLVKFARDRLPHFSNGKKQSRHRLVFHRGHPVIRRDRLDALREAVLALREHHRSLVYAALILEGDRIVSGIS